MKYLLITLLMLACSSQAPKEEPIVYGKDHPEVNTTNPKSPSIVAKQIAAEKGSNFVTELSFAKGSSKLKKKERKKIRKLITRTKSLEIKSIQIISWPDADKKEEIAQERIATVRKFLEKSIKNPNSIKEANMARDGQSEVEEIKKSLKIQKAQKDIKSQVILIFIPKN